MLWVAESVSSPEPIPATLHAQGDGRSLQRLWPFALFGALFLCVVGLVLHYELAPRSAEHVAEPFFWTDAERDGLMMWVLIGMTAALGAHAILARFTKLPLAKLRPLAVAVLASLTFGLGLAYFYGANGARSVYPHLHDNFHYLLGPKYFAELGYDGLYDCVVQAATPSQVPDNMPVRDLATDEMTMAAKIRQQPSCRGAFSDARWVEFQHDLGLYTRYSARGMKGPLGDRGYNGSPLQTFLASTLAQSFELSYEALSLVTLIDVFSLCLMLACVCAAFGAPLGLVCAVLFFTEFVDRHLIIGGSFLRYQWLTALGLGLIALQRKRYGWAGVALALATALNVFPVLFMGAFLLREAHHLYRERRVSDSLRRFLLGASITAVLCLGLGAAHANGLGNYRQFADAMRVHNAAGRAPGFGVGLKYDFLSSDFKTAHAQNRRNQELKEARPWILLSSSLLLLWMLALLPRLDDVEGAILCGFTGLFCVFGPTGYYYAFAAFLVLLFHRKLRDAGGLWMLALLFALSVPPYAATLAGAHRFYAFNRVVSATWTVYLLALLGSCSLLPWRREGGGDQRRPMG